MIDPATGAVVGIDRNSTTDHLSALHSRRHIDDAQFQGGRLYQSDVEAAERGSLRAFDPTREKVDGGLAGFAQPYSEARRKAQDRLAGANAAMGLSGAALVRDALIGGLSMGEIALKRDPLWRLPGGTSGLQTPTAIALNRYGKAHLLKLGVILHTGLDNLAVYYGLATRAWN